MRVTLFLAIFPELQTFKKRLTDFPINQSVKFFWLNKYTAQIYNFTIYKFTAKRQKSICRFGLLWRKIAHNWKIKLVTFHNHQKFVACCAKPKKKLDIFDFLAWVKLKKEKVQKYSPRYNFYNFRKETRLKMDALHLQQTARFESVVKARILRVLGYCAYSVATWLKFIAS